MARWLVQLSGDHMDLEEFPRCFPDGDISAVEENGAFFLLGPAFEVLPNSKAVLGEATRTPATSGCSAAARFLFAVCPIRLRP